MFNSFNDPISQVINGMFMLVVGVFALTVVSINALCTRVYRLVFKSKTKRVRGNGPDYDVDIKDANN